MNQESNHVYVQTDDGQEYLIEQSTKGNVVKIHVRSQGIQALVPIDQFSLNDKMISLKNSNGEVFFKSAKIISSSKESKMNYLNK